MIIQNEEDLQKLKAVGKVVATIREEMRAQTKPGVTTKQLDELAGSLFEKFGAISGPKAEYDFPGYTCISVNDEVAHGIPSDYVIQEGDLVNIDVSGSLDGYYADTGVSFVVGKGSAELEALCEAAEKSFYAAMKKVKAGSKQSQIGRAVYAEASKNGYEVILNLAGHGVGKSLHEPPEFILNYYDPANHALLKEGQVLAVEPFISNGADEVIESGDGWTYKTPDGSFVAQLEHTIIVTKGEPTILTR